MNTKKIKLELLAPAKNLESGMAAIDCGADAVYIGAPQFSARVMAGNTIADIEQLAKYAHIFGAKVFVALNTILYENELENAQKIIHNIYHAGADALIIQDMGILEMPLPPIAIHASTQTNNFDLPHIKFLDRLGIQRIILARELPLHQIEQIRNETHCELEFFVGGALCVCMSGACYLSHSIGGRSANRGKCAQPCRMPYNLIDSKGNILIKNKHLLSIKDLNLSEAIPALAEAGIMSFKIEGRLKDENYVRNTVTHYRKVLNSFIEKNNKYTKASDGKIVGGIVPNLNKTFNRNFTPYFINGRKEFLSNWDSPKWVGEKLGEVSRVAPAYFEIATNEAISNGDGLTFYDKNGELKGIKVNTAVKNRVYPNHLNDIFAGAMVYRNLDTDFQRKLQTDVAKRKIEIRISVDETPEGLTFKAYDTIGNEVSMQLNEEKVEAKNREKAKQTIETQLMKSGDTQFWVKEVKILNENYYFFPTSKLNEIRRLLLEQLFAEREKNYTRQEFVFAPNEAAYPLTELSYKSNVTNTLAKKFYTRHGVTDIEPAFELQKTDSEKEVMTTHYCIKWEMRQCHKQKPSEKLQEPLFLVNHQSRLELQFDCKACVMHLQTIPRG